MIISFTTRVTDTRRTSKSMSRMTRTKGRKMNTTTMRGQRVRSTNKRLTMREIMAPFILLKRTREGSRAISRGVRIQPCVETKGRFLNSGR